MVQRVVPISSMFLFALTFSAAQSFGQYADNQKILSPERVALTNPAPTERNFSEINKKHQILMAVIDTGVDYNHPGLIEHLHFNLDEKGQPVGIGWDYTANDAWPAPLIAKSADLDRSAPPEVINSEKELANGITEFLALYPQFTPLMNSDRHVIQELSSGLYHGTHVAGLMVYDEPKLGLLAYRVLPMNIGYVGGRMTILDTEDNLPLALIKAIKDGARVINMSLGTAINKMVQQQDPNFFDSQIKVMSEIKKIAAANPGVAFIAASGNDGTWIDDKSRMGLPCGVNSKNILCVGALGVDGEAAAFSNIVLPDYPFLMAPGEDIYSFFPTQFCPAPGNFIRALGQLSQIGGANQKTFYFKSLAKYCEAAGNLYSSSGTSMASPIAARMVAKALLANPKLSGAEAIQKVLSDSVGASIGRLNVKKLKIEKPSWYPKNNPLPLAKALTLDLSGEDHESSEPEYFEFYTK